MPYTATSITLLLNCDEIIEIECEVGSDPEVMLDFTTGELWFETKQIRIEPTFPNSPYIAQFHFTPDHAEKSEGLQRPARLLFKKDDRTYQLWSLSLSAELGGTASSSGIVRLSRLESTPVRIVASQGIKGDKGDKGDDATFGVGDGLTRDGDIISVATSIARTAAVTSALGNKADKTDVASSLALKANTSDVTAALASKANASDVASSLATKASTSDLSAGLASKANTSHTHDASAITGLSSVATSGNYNDLTNKPTSVGINDTATSTSTTYSSSKVESLAATKASASHTHDASAIATGTLGVDRIPTLPLSKISGLGDGAIFDGSTNSDNVSVAQTTFTTVKIANIASNNIGTWDATNNELTITTTGAYFAYGTIRYADNTTSGVDYGLGVATSNADNPKFIWNMTTTKRQGHSAIRIGTLTAGDKVRLVTYIEGASCRYVSASLSIFPVSAAAITALSNGSGASINDNSVTTTTTYSSNKIEAFVNAAVGGKANATHTHSAADIVSGTLAVARLPVISYNSLSDKPTIPQIVDGSASSTSVYSSTKVEALAATKASSTHTHAYSDLTGRPTFATVATTGSYNDLTDKPAASTGSTQSVDIQVFTASGTWTKPTAAKLVEVFLIGGGGGGGAGYKGAADTARAGGGGGGGCGVSIRSFGAAVLPATVTVTVGAGGAGATGPTSNDTRGNSGSAGGVTQFGAFVTGNYGGGGGSGGLSSSGSGGSGTSGTPGNSGVSGASAPATGGVAGGSGSPTVGSLGACGGGSGGGISTANTPQPGTMGGGDNNGVTPNSANQSGTPGAASTTSTDAGAGSSAVARAALELRGGLSGAGGGANSSTGAGGNGGAGAFPGGGGGGGGAATNGGGAAGSGGNGGNGLAVIITYF